MQNAYIRMVLYVRERNTPNVIVVKKNDTARTLRIQLVDGNAAYTIGPECTAVMTALKADGTKLFNSCTVEENVVVYPFTEQTCSCAGRMICEVRVIGSDGKMLTSASFTMVVLETAYTDGDTVSQGEADALSKLVAEANQHCGSKQCCIRGERCRMEGETDATGQQWVCDEVDLERGVYVKRIGSTKGVSWTQSNVTPRTVGERYRIKDSNLLIDDYSKAICSSYPYRGVASYSVEGDYVSIGENDSIRIRCKDKLFGDATEFNRWVNETGLVAYYQLANPIEMPLSPETDCRLQSPAHQHSERFGSGDGSEVHCGHETIHR